MLGDVVEVEGVGAGLVVPSETFVDGIPFGFGAGEVDVGYVKAITEYKIPNARYAVGNDHPVHSRAIAKRLVTYAGQAIGYDHRGQSRASTKRTVGNNRQAAANDNGRQAAACAKRTFTQTGNTIGNH